MVNPLLDKDFLKQLDTSKHKTIYAKVTSLTFDELPIEEITGRVTQGSINVDGNSAVRRTCSLSMVAKEVNINDYYWGVNSKFSLSIGLENNINPRYPKIIWFPQGIYLFTSFNTSQSLNNFTISLQGKDKMALLNGEIGGSLTALSYDFGTYDQKLIDGSIENVKLQLKDIIRHVVHEYAREPFSKIIINDLDEVATELLEYRGNYPMFFFIKADGDGSFDVVNMTMSNSQRIWYDKDGVRVQGTIKDLEESDFDKLMQLEFVEGANIAKKVYLSDSLNADAYTIAKIEYGETAGYRATELVYPGDLFAAVGEPVTAVLDKIKNVLGEFEYFYDIDGRFIFQKKKNYVQTSFNNIVKDDYVESAVLSSSSSYSFEDGVLISSFGNTPNLLNLRNDFSIWGTKKSVTGKELPVHLRYAIDDKPKYYKNTEGKIFISDLEILNEIKKEIEDRVTISVKKELDEYQPAYSNTYGLPLPEKQDDGSYSSGWWDIRDWHDYYVLLTGKEPLYTMKWYSQNNETGFVHHTEIPLPMKGNNISFYEYSWLIIVNPRTGEYNPQHGGGNPWGGYRTCTLYESKLNPDGTYAKPTKVTPVQEKDFMYPYASCNDQHTYGEFLQDDIQTQGNLVYFYNPNFPNATFGELVEEKVEREYQELMKNIYHVDWREIIYQMAIDYGKNSRNDDFFVDLAQRNLTYYPDGKTGYEQYYTDMEGFWRQLYDIEQEPAFEPIDILTTEISDDDLFVYGMVPLGYVVREQKNDKGEMEQFIRYKTEDVDLDNFYVFTLPNNGIMGEPGHAYIYSLFDAHCRLDPNGIYYKKEADGEYKKCEEEELKTINIRDIYIKPNSNQSIYEKYTDNILKKLKSDIDKNKLDVYYLERQKFINVNSDDALSCYKERIPVFESVILDNFGAPVLTKRKKKLENGEEIEVESFTYKETKIYYFLEEH